MLSSFSDQHLLDGEGSGWVVGIYCYETSALSCNEILGNSIDDMLMRDVSLFALISIMPLALNILGCLYQLLAFKCSCTYKANVSGINLEKPLGYWCFTLIRIEYIFCTQILISKSFHIPGLNSADS